MELKKNPEADVNKKRPMFFFVGLVVSLGVVLLSFEWKAYEAEVQQLGSLNVELEEEEMIPITQMTPPPPPPPPPQTTIIEIVEDDEELEEELEIEDTEVDEEEVIEFVEFVEEEVVEEPEIFMIVEDMPTFPGGEAELFNYLAKNIKYPPMAKEAGVQGIVYLGFIIMEDGSVADVKVLRGLDGIAGEKCNQEAIRVVKAMPDWKPGKQRGKAVRVQYNLPVRFKLQ